MNNTAATRSEIIEGFSDYAIMMNGNIINRKTGEIKIKKSMRVDKVTNIIATTLRNDNGQYRNRYLHTLLATAFIPNPNNYSAVGFKDGNKMNLSLGNLYWTPHAFRGEQVQGLETKTPKIGLTRAIAAIKTVVADDEVDAPAESTSLQSVVDKAPDNVIKRIKKAVKYIFTGSF